MPTIVSSPTTILALSPVTIFALGVLAAALLSGVLARFFVGRAQLRLRLGCRVLIGISVCVFGVALLLWQVRLPMLEASVVIEKVGVQTTGRGSEQTNMVVRLSTGGTALLKGSGRNEFFRPGQRMEVRYQQETGLIDRARFVNSTGVEEGQYRSYIWIARYTLMLLGAIQIVSSIRVFRRESASLPPA